jgi:hypothetical protein
MPLTDVEIRKAKTKDKAYRMSDSGSPYLWVTPPREFLPRGRTLINTEDCEDPRIQHCNSK